MLIHGNCASVCAITWCVYVVIGPVLQNKTSICLLCVLQSAVLFYAKLLNFVVINDPEFFVCLFVCFLVQ